MVYKQSKRSNPIKPSLFLQKTDKVLLEIDNEINAHRSGSGSISNVTQLEIIKEQVNCMIQNLSSSKFMPSYQRMIIDSWDYSNNLGIELLALYEEYLKL
ncbi:hypothetical protein [Alkaliphilus crotonatoxidans]